VDPDHELDREDVDGQDFDGTALDGADLGGDPPCWAHLFEDAKDEAAPCPSEPRPAR
jgi:hypothetical protein